MAHHHQAKRPYNGSQPAITSYFSSNGTYTSAPSHVSEPRYQPPATIQANLLSVGMRVRKSVPEGYKTGSSYSSFALFSDPSTNTPHSQTSSPSIKKGTRPRARELTPFCGILKVGGMAQQAWGVYNPSPHAQEFEESQVLVEDDDDDCPALSQGSTISSSSIDTPVENYPIFGQLNPGNKRRFSEEDEEVMMHHPGFGDRIIAKPRRKRNDSNGKFGTGHISAFGLGQENKGDFEEAEFLDYGLAREVEMSDV